MTAMPATFGTRRASAALAFLLLVALGLGLASWSGDVPRVTPPAAAPTADDDYGQLPLSFMRDGGEYVAATAAGSIALHDAGATITPTSGERVGEPIEIGLAGAAAASPRAVEKLPGVVNDLRGDDPSKWRSDIPTYARVRYAEVYPGIAMDYHGTTGTLEYDFRVAPGAEPSRITVDFHGAPLRVTGAGALVVGSGANRVRQAAPVAYQPSADGRDPVAASFRVHGDRVGFDLGAYDASRPLVIDPLVLSYATLLGGSPTSGTGNGDDYIHDVAIDSSGNAYLAGDTSSSNFPTTAGAYDQTRQDEQTYHADAFVTKLNPSGTSIVYSTYLGGFYSDTAKSIAVDSSGNAYVTGQTNSTRNDGSAKFPVAGGGYSTSNDTGSGDVFVTKLNSTGTALTYSAVFGGSSTDTANGIAVDSAGNAFIAGATNSGASVMHTPYPTGSAYQGTYGGNSGDAFVTKLNAAGSAFVYSTYLGGSGQDGASGIDIDSTGRAYVTGFTTAFSANNFPTTAGGYKAVDPNSADAFLTKLSASGTSLDYSTTIGTDGTGSNDGSDYASAVAVGPTDGIAYITGSTSTTGQSGADFPLKNAYMVRNGQCCYGLDAFVAKFDTTASGSASLLYSTVLSSSGAESGTAIDIDSAGNAYVGGVIFGSPTGTFYPTTSDELGGGTNRGRAFVTKLVQSGNTSATLGFSTTIQGTGTDDELGGLVYDEAAGAVYVGGTSRNGTPFVTTPGAYKANTSATGEREGFAAKITVSNDVTPPNTTIMGGPTNGGTVTSNPVGFTFSADETSTFECKYDAGVYAPCTSPGPGSTGADSRSLSNGSHTFYVRAKDAANNVDATPETRTFTVNLADTTPPDTSITSGPADGSTVTSSSVTFGFSSTESGSSFECSIDGGAYTACTSPGPGTAGSDTRTLANGSHTFAVRARDGSNNVDASPATRSFTVNVSTPPPADTTPPETTVTKAPPKSVKARRSATVKVEFSASESGSTFACSVDGGAATGCSSPATFKLVRGKHTIAITATDAAGNRDASPATVEVNVKKKGKKKGKGKN